MKKVSTVMLALFLGATLAVAQNTGGDKQLNPQPLPPGRHPMTTSTTTTTNPGKHKAKGHKGGRKSKKGSASTTPPPK